MVCGRHACSCAEFQYVVYTNTIKFKNQANGYYLHSHEVQYVGGSGEQVRTRDEGARRGCET